MRIFPKITTLISCISLLFTQFNINSSLAREVDSSTEQELLIWRVDPKPGSIYSVYILGSYHIGTDCQLESRAFEHAFKDAEEIIFEVDSLSDPMLGMKAQQSLMNLIREEGIPSSQEESLKGLLDEKTYELLKQKSAAQGLPLDNIANLKPWVFMLMQQSQQMSETEQKPECGLDLMIEKKARSNNKPTAGLETIDYQLKLFTDSLITLKTEEIIEYLNWIAESEKEEDDKVKDYIDDYLNNLTTSIDRGDLTEIEFAIDESCQEDLERCQSFLFDRNDNWLPIIEEFLTLKEDKLIVVGAGHLVGERGVINLLKEKGYSVRRFRNSELRAKQSRK